jgi:predicted enzyme related to lactoylglutathione lyase
MVSAIRLERAFEPMMQGAVPASRTVSNLEAAIGLVRRLGGSVTSETRTAPGIGSWAFVADRDGSELLLWENAASSALG